jgi:hypothetical protein
LPSVCGLFSVRMEVCDASNACIGLIDAATVGPRHVVNVENISSVPRGARVLSSLPQGTRRLEFQVAGAAVANWDKSVLRIPPGNARELECGLHRHGRATGPNEPLQCDEVHEQRGALAWRAASLAERTVSDHSECWMIRGRCGSGPCDQALPSWSSYSTL